MAYVGSVILGYLLGSIPVGLIFDRRWGNFVEESGDRTAGALATYRQAGLRAALPVFTGNAAKGLVAGLVGLALGGEVGGYLGVAAAIVGDSFPLLAKKTGGQGVSTFVGGSIALAPFACLIAAEFGVVVWLATSRERAIQFTLISLPFWQLATNPGPRPLGTLGLLALVGLRWLELRRSTPPPEAETERAMAQRRAKRAEKLAAAAEKHFEHARAETSEGRELVAQAQRLTEEAREHSQLARTGVREEAEDEQHDLDALEQQAQRVAAQAEGSEDRLAGAQGPGQRRRGR